MNQERLEELLTAASLGCSDSAEEADLNYALETFPEARSELDTFKSIAARLACLAPMQADPREELKDAVFSRLAETKLDTSPKLASLSASQSQFPPFDNILAWAAVVVFGAFAMWVGLDNSKQRYEITQLKEVVFDPQRVQVAVLDQPGDADFAESWAGMIKYCAMLEEARLQVSGLPTTDPSSSYQIWMVCKEQQRPWSVGLFQVSADGPSVIALSVPASLGTVEEWIITKERAGGVEQAEGPVVLAGRPQAY
ncbi:MAG: anti-sigma factor domain-containing protein [Verrucomicrobiales bacterium]